MASNVTQHYQLCQWEPGDKVERLDFNGDNEKIDAAVKAAADVAGEAKALAQTAYTPENPSVVFGSYTGDGTVKRKIELGFTPRAVFVSHCNGSTVAYGTGPNSYYGGLALPGLNVSTSNSSGVAEWADGKTVLAVTEGGFLVNYVDRSIYSNEESNVSYYIAFR